MELYTPVLVLAALAAGFAVFSVVITSVGQAIFGTSARMSAQAMVLMNPTCVETAVRPMKLVHQATPSGGNVPPRRPAMLCRAQGSTPCRSTPR